jgi:hypothetical protein
MAVEQALVKLRCAAHFGAATHPLGTAKRRGILLHDSFMLDMHSDASEQQVTNG